MRYRLEYDHPIEGLSDWILKTQLFEADTDGDAQDQLIAFVAATKIEPRVFSFSGVTQSKTRHARPRSFICATEDETRRGVTIPWDRLREFSMGSNPRTERESKPLTRFIEDHPPG